MEKVLSRIENVFFIFITVTGHVYLIKVLKDLNISLYQLRLFLKCYLIMFLLVTLGFYMIFMYGLNNTKENILYSIFYWGVISGQFFLMEYFNYIIAAEICLLAAHVIVKLINFISGSEWGEIKCVLKKMIWKEKI